MRKIMKMSFSQVLLIFCFLTITQVQHLFSYTNGLFMLTVQFPKSLKDIPNFRIYCEGNKIKGDINKNSKRVTFALPEDKKRTHFTLIITEKIQFKSEENTILYLKLADEQPYKFYSLQLIKTDPQAQEEKDSRKDPIYQWIIEEQKVSLEDGRIPDDAIIICIDPSYIEKLEGGNAIELPKIFIKEDAVQLAGSESKFDDSWTKILLSSLDADSIHANLQHEVKQEQHRSRVAIIS